jgi:predicted transcriptional regulator of viral defense system
VNSPLPMTLDAMGANGERAGRQHQAWPDREIAELAATQATNVTHAQLCALGVRPSTTAAALSRARLHSVHHGVYSLVPAAVRPPLAAEHAALLACGPRALLSHGTALRLHGIPLAGPSVVHVTVVGTNRSRTRPHLCVHRTGVLPRPERARVGRLPVTSVARTVLDVAAGQSDGFVEQLVDRALKRTSRTKLIEALDRHPGRPGTPAVRRALDPGRPSGDTWSVPEKRLLALLRRAGVPLPEANVGVGRYFPDLLWREQRVIIEYDSREFHSGERARTYDAARHNDLTNWGFDVLHVTWAHLSEQPERVLVWIAAALTRRGWSPAA